MKYRHSLPACAAALTALALTLTPLSAQVVFSESFEAPVVSGFSSNTLPSGGKWIGTTQGFGANNRGLYNEAVAWPATPLFNTPYGSQAYLLNGPNNGMTTAQNATGLVVTEGVEVKVSFHTAILSGNTSSNYLVQLVAFDATEDNSKRNDVRETVGKVLASAAGTVTTHDFSTAVSFSYTPTGADPVGHDLGIRLLRPSGNLLYDNVRVIVGHDFNPNPKSGVNMPAGNTALSWTNMLPNAPATDVHVDVFFGTDPGNLNLVVDGGLNTSTTQVNAGAAGTYYWRVDSYLDGDPNGTAVTGDVFFFTVTDTDGDGIPDVWEIQYFGGPTAADANADSDNDGLTNLQEYIRGTDPTNPDTDGDGLLDGVETATGIWVSASDTGTLPLVADSDNDGLSDGVETNTGVWVSASNTGTNPNDPDWDKDGLKDGAETNTGVFLSRFDTGTDPFNNDSDGDGVWDWYEVAAALTDPNDPADKPAVPYPLPDPDGSAGVSNKPVKVYIMAGQSNTVGIGQVNGTAPGTLETIAKRENKFPNLVDASNNWIPRNDVLYRGVVTATARGPLAPGQGASSTQLGPELGFGHIMGWYHDEPVLILKASQGNRSLGWDFLPPGSPRQPVANPIFAAYGEAPQTSPTGIQTVFGAWYGGKQYDDCFRSAADTVTSPPTWQDGVAYARDATVVHKGFYWICTTAHTSAPATEPDTGASWTTRWRMYENAYSVLAKFDTLYPQWADQGYEIAGFCWWQGHKDQDGSNNPYAALYQDNLVQLINALRADFNAPNAPVVVASIGFGGEPLSNKQTDFQQVFNAQMAVQDLPQFAGTVKSVDILKYWREVSESPTNQDFHYNQNAETYMLVGDAMGRAMLEMQDDTSPPSPNPLTFAVEPTAVDATTVGMVATTAFDVSGPVEYFFENITTEETSGWITDTRWDNTGLAAGSYDYRVKARDALGNEGDWSTTVSASPGADVTAPAPAPAFTGPLTVLGENSISMAATAAFDINGVEYFFACTVGGGPDSGWQSGTSFTALGLSPGTEYTYVVRARDSLGNVTADSAPASATTTAPDTTAPSPDPMTFATAPTAIGTNAITMTATIASDESGVEYFFEAVSGGTSSGWQDSATYTDTTLAPGTEYGYRVRARDKSPAQNTTDWSEVFTATTEVPDTTPPSPDPMTFASSPAATGPNSIIMTATTASDPNGVEYLFANVTLGTDSGWQTSPVFTSTGLQPETEYVYQVKARDLSENLNETAFSAPAAATTTAAPSGPGGAVIYEPFDDADATLAGNTPGFGLTGTWSAGGGTAVVAGSLAFGDLTTTGNRVSVTSGSNATVNFGSTLAEAGLLANGATLWFSFIVQTDAASSTNDQAAFVLGTGALGTGNNIPMSSGNSGIGISYFRGTRLKGASWNNAISETGPNSGLATNTPTLLVAKIEWGADDEAAETITIYKPNAALELPATAHAVHTAPALNQAGFSSISFTRKGDAGKVDFYDEIRFGATYEDVIGLGGGDPDPGPVDSFEISPIASPQTVGTPITGITLTARDAEGAIATGFTGTVTFGGTGGFTGTSASFVDGVLENVSVTPTISGSNLTFTVDDGAGSTGSTTLATIDPAPGAFDTWSGNLAFDVDTSGDGIANGMAWVLGASDPSADATALLPTFDNASDPDFFVFTYRRLDAAANSPNTTIAVEYGSDLSGWTVAAPGDDVVIHVDDDGAAPGVDLVAVRIRRTLATDGKLFSRLRAVVGEP